jgi:hypothetical protein
MGFATGLSLGARIMWSELCRRDHQPILAMDCSYSSKNELSIIADIGWFISLVMGFLGGCLALGTYLE